MEKLRAMILIFFERYLKVKVLRTDTWSLIMRLEPANAKILRWSRLPEGDFFGLQSFVLEHIQESPSQLQQDLVAQFISSKYRKVLDTEIPPFYVEVGANDGVYLSNTLILQEKFGWQGILSEANDMLKSDLVSNRKGAIIDFRAVSHKTGEKIVFNVAENSEYSAIEGYSIQEDQFTKSTMILKETISLNDLLDQFNAPKVIDFLSVDTEGSEFEILSGLNWSLYRFNFIAVEVSRNGREIAELLNLNGYKQVLHEISRWDQWWIDAPLLRELDKAK